MPSYSLCPYGAEGIAPARREEAITPPHRARSAWREEV